MELIKSRDIEKENLILEINKEAALFYYNNLNSGKYEKASEYYKTRKLTPETMRKFGLGCTTEYSDSLYRYLRKKGYTDDQLKDSGLITISDKESYYKKRDKFWDRVIIPIKNEQGRIVAFGGRITDSDGPKYLNSPETAVFNKSKTLFGLNYAKNTSRKYFIACEGFMDAISLHQAGFDNAVASLGTALTEGHAEMLKRYTDIVYLSYDSDTAGQKAAFRAISILKAAGIRCKVIDMTPFKDPDEFLKNYGAEEYEKRIKNAESSFAYQVKMLKQKYNKEDFERETSRLIFEEYPNKILRRKCISLLASRFNIDQDAFIKNIEGHEQAKEEKIKIPAAWFGKDSKECQEEIKKSLLPMEKSEEKEIGERDEH